MLETSWHEQAFAILHEADAKNCVREIWVSVTGKFGDNGGVEGKDFFVYTGFRKACRSGAMSIING
jgi:hypothetical protein